MKKDSVILAIVIVNLVLTVGLLVLLWLGNYQHERLERMENGVVYHYRIRPEPGATTVEATDPANPQPTPRCTRTPTPVPVP
jgi:hypothetical protein